jgi:hypothetical protein
MAPTFRKSQPALNSKHLEFQMLISLPSKGRF